MGGGGEIWAWAWPVLGCIPGQALARGRELGACASPQAGPSGSESRKPGDLDRRPGQDDQPSAGDARLRWSPGRACQQGWSCRDDDLAGSAVSLGKTPSLAAAGVAGRAACGSGVTGRTVMAGRVCGGRGWCRPVRVASGRGSLCGGHQAAAWPGGLLLGRRVARGRKPGLAPDRRPSRPGANQGTPARWHAPRPGRSAGRGGGRRRSSPGQASRRRWSCRDGDLAGGAVSP